MKARFTLLRILVLVGCLPLIARKASVGACVKTAEGHAFTRAMELP